MLTLTSKPVREAMLTTLKERAASVTKRLGRKPRLVVVIVGDNPASVIYVSHKEKMSTELGIQSETLRFAADTSPEIVRKKISELNADPTVDGILIQRPLPSQFIESEVLLWVHPSKDVDAFHPETVGRMSLGLPGFKPCTPAGVMRLLEHYGYSVAGKTACVIGRSSIVGKPLAQLLLQADATVVMAHSKTKDLPKVASSADFLFVAIGRPEFIDSSYVKEGAVVIDVGISKNAAGKTVGDVNFAEAAKKASAVTPVPGSVGPMTILLLMENTLQSAEDKIH